MKYNNRLYPHPVMGIRDDVEGEFHCKLTVESGKEHIILKPLFFISNDAIETLIKRGDAMICMQIYCRGTLFRQHYSIIDPLSDEIKIDASRLNGEVEVDFFICVNRVGLQYTNSKFDPIFKGEIFTLDKGDLLAYGGKGKFFANKSPEQLKAVASIMKIKKGEFQEGPFYNEYEDSKFITVLLSASDFDYYHHLSSDKDHVNIIHASLVVPSLIAAAHFMESENSGSEEFKNSEWYLVLENILSEAKGNSILEKIQNILDLPINREFLTMIQMTNDD